MTRVHGVLRGLSYVDRSSTMEARFGRMFRWLPGQTYKDSDLNDLAKVMVQREIAHFRAPGEAGPPDEPVTEGPDVVFNPPDPPNSQLDTAFGEPEPADENPTIPAGYTYFGQFIDHDLTFDPNSSLQKQNDPDATVDFRTPRFDLDSLYGRGPDDQPYLYQNTPKAGEKSGGVRFLLGRKGGDPAAERRGDLPRNVDGRALVGDPRNGENDVVCQVQALFLNFHNKVVDAFFKAQPGRDPHEVFLAAQRIVRWHYQYLVLNDYLPRIVGEKTWRAVFQGGGNGRPQPNVCVYRPKGGQAYMPVEFSVAAFRFGHSMVRPSYALRAGEAAVGGSADAFSGDGRFHRIPIFSDKRLPATSLNGFGPLPREWEIDWRLFFADGEMPTETTASGPDKGVIGVKPQAGDQLAQPGYRIDTALVDPLAMLPPDVAKSGNEPDGIPTLAFRNLVRSSAFALPSGQDVARALHLDVLTEEELWSDVTAKDGTRDFSDLRSNPFVFRAPLWFYILKEAQRTKRISFEQDTLGGHHLGPVGGRIVAEVLVGVALNDHTSYLYQDPGWTPAAEKAKSGFDAGPPLNTLFELIRWTTDGAMRF